MSRQQGEAATPPVDADNYQHIVGGTKQTLIDVLKIGFLPLHALCGYNLDTMDNGIDPGFAGLPICPECARITGWDAGHAPPVRVP